MAEAVIEQAPTPAARTPSPAPDPDFGPDFGPGFATDSGPDSGPGFGDPGRLVGTGSTDPVSVGVVAEPESFGGWVQAAPFRSHLLHLMAVTGLPWRVLAHLAGASPRAVVRLLQGRSGRPVRKIDPLLARRLFALTTEEVRLARDTPVDPGRAMDALAELVAAGHHPGLVAARLRVSTDLLLALQDGRRGIVSRLLEAQLWAAVEATNPLTPLIGDDADDGTGSETDAAGRDAAGPDAQDGTGPSADRAAA